MRGQQRPPLPVPPPGDTPLAGFDLPQPREREVAVTAKLWGWIPEDDRQVLLDAEFGPDDLNAPIERVF
ncbi:hypothetical protein Psi02_62430 [Planotetraspora silvatica]|uniref:Uncharacterized protein n=1 Tax=Planotetraspora silvatica TaxID=234614 RepID=A0A8J3XQX2_9ACTN|nr:hypothetical protein Psi02_62430 [Planotetraspora silvatica]